MTMRSPQRFDDLELEHGSKDDNKPHSRFASRAAEVSPTNKFTAPGDGLEFDDVEGDHDLKKAETNRTMFEKFLENSGTMRPHLEKLAERAEKLRPYWEQAKEKAKPHVSKLMVHYKKIETDVKKSPAYGHAVQAWHKAAHVKFHISGVQLAAMIILGVVAGSLIQDQFSSPGQVEVNHGLIVHHKTDTAHGQRENAEEVIFVPEPFKDGVSPAIWAKQLAAHRKAHDINRAISILSIGASDYEKVIMHHWDPVAKQLFGDEEVPVCALVMEPVPTTHWRTKRSLHNLFKVNDMPGDPIQSVQAAFCDDSVAETKELFHVQEHGEVSRELKKWKESQTASFKREDLEKAEGIKEEHITSSMVPCLNGITYRKPMQAVCGDSLRVEHEVDILVVDTETFDGEIVQEFLRHGNIANALVFEWAHMDEETLRATEEALAEHGYYLYHKSHLDVLYFYGYEKDDNGALKRVFEGYP